MAISRPGRSRSTLAGPVPVDDVTYTGLTILGGTGGDTITNSAANGVITEGATAATLHNTLTVSGAGAIINDQASAGTDTIILDGVNVTTVNLGSGGTATASTSVICLTPHRRRRSTTR